MNQDVTSLALDWPYVLSSLGIDESFLRNEHGPCPVCGGKDRFRFIDKDGKGTFFCNQCRHGDGWTLLQLKNGWDFKTAAEEVRKLLGGGQGFAPFSPAALPAEDDARKRAKAKESLTKTTKSSRAAKRGDPVDTYLRNRGLVLTVLPAALRYAKLPYWKPGKTRKDKPIKLGVFDVMLAVVQAPDGRPLTLHRTYIRGGRKADVPEVKKLMTATVRNLAGAAVRLFDAIGDTLLLAEGIETAIAVHLRTGLPVWAGISKDLLASVVVPAHIRKVYIFADNDPDGAGQACAEQAAARFRAEGRYARVYTPPTADEDWADIYVRKYVMSQQNAA